MSGHSSSEPPSAGRPSVCRNCGAIVGAGEKECAVCGAPLATAAAGQVAARRPVYDREAMRFARAILTRPAPFTIAFVVANIFVFLLTMMSAKSAGGTAMFNAALVAYGGKVNSLINQRGEWWRFVTPIFLHGSGLHLLMNMYGLWILGPFVERLYGSAKFVFFWVLTGVAGVVASYLTVRPGMQLNAVSRFLFKNVDSVSIGASGALFGLIGVLFVFGIKFRHELPDGFKRAFGTGMLPTILLNVFIGFAIPVIDNAAHLGGLVAGAALALVVGYKRPTERQRVAIFWHVLQVAALLLVAVSFVMVARHFRGTPPSPRNLSPDVLFNTGPDTTSYSEALNGAQRVVVNALKSWDASGAEDAAKALDAAPNFDEKADGLRNELKQLLTRAQALAKIPPDQRTGARARALHEELGQDLMAWVEKRNAWIKTDGEKYGMKLVETKDSPDKQSEEQQPESQNQNQRNKK